MMKSIKILDELKKQIEETTSKIEKRRRVLQLNQIKIESNLKDLQEAKNEVFIAEGVEETLMANSNAVRQKINSFDGSAKDQSKELNADMKAYFKKLGIKVSTELSAVVQDGIEMTLSFSDNPEYHATFDFIPQTEQYDLKKIHPEQPKFNELRDYLRETMDIQGLLVNFRNKMLLSLKRK